MEEQDPPDIFRCTFFIYPNAKVTYCFKALKSSVRLVDVSNNDKWIDVAYSDITGCDLRKGKKENDTAAYLSIFCYVHKKKLIGESSNRQRKVYTLQFSKKNSYEENFRDVHLWKVILINLINGADLQTISSGNCFILYLCSL